MSIQLVPVLTNKTKTQVRLGSLSRSLTKKMEDLWLGFRFPFPQRSKSPHSAFNLSDIVCIIWSWILVTQWKGQKRTDAWYLNTIYNASYRIITCDIYNDHYTCLISLFCRNACLLSSVWVDHFYVVCDSLQRCNFVSDCNVECLTEKASGCQLT
jgi:hypothetical protein